MGALDVFTPGGLVARPLRDLSAHEDDVHLASLEDTPEPQVLGRARLEVRLAVRDEEDLDVQGSRPGDEVADPRHELGCGLVAPLVPARRIARAVLDEPHLVGRVVQDRLVHVEHDRRRTRVRPAGGHLRLERGGRRGVDGAARRVVLGRGVDEEGREDEVGRPTDPTRGLRRRASGQEREGERDGEQGAAVHGELVRARRIGGTEAYARSPASGPHGGPLRPPVSTALPRPPGDRERRARRAAPRLRRWPAVRPPSRARDGRSRRSSSPRPRSRPRTRTRRGSRAARRWRRGT